MHWCLCSNIRVQPITNQIQTDPIKDLGIIMSQDCCFEHHVLSLSKHSNLAGWILRTFSTRDKDTMLTLFKSLIMSRLDYCGLLLSWNILILLKVYRGLSLSILKVCEIYLMLKGFLYLNFIPFNGDMRDILWFIFGIY